jgi:hypothetical protein
MTFPARLRSPALLLALAGLIWLIGPVPGGSANAQKGPAAPGGARGEGGAAAQALEGGLAATARRAAGAAPVLLAIVGDAVELRSADGAFKTTLARGPVASAVYDPALELVWVRRLGQLEVWDLRQDKPRAIPVLADAADEGDFAIQRGDHRVAPGGACIVPGSMVVHWSKRPSVEVLGFDEMDAPPQPRLVGAAWLAREAGRPARAVPLTTTPLPAPAGSESRVTLPGTVGRCSEPRQCGSGVPFGGTGWTLVVGAEDQGADCQHFRCLLRDPQAKTFGKPPLPATWSREPRRSMLGPCGLYRFAAGGKWFAVDDRVCAVGGSCSTLGPSAQVFGWLDGEHDLGSGS